MMRMYRILAALLLLLGTACSTPDNSEPPAELVEIENPKAMHKLWSVDTGDGVARNFFDMQPLLLGSKIYSIDTLGVILQIDSKKGHVDWRFESGLPAINGLGGYASGLVATSRNGEVVMYDFTGSSLSERWKQQLSSEIRVKAIVDGGQVFVRSVDGKLTALDASNGSVQWTVSRRVPALSLTGNSYPIVSSDLVIAGFDNGKMAAFERDNGTSVWETTVGSPSGRSEIERLVDLDGPFILRDGILYVSSFQGNLVAVTVSNGQILWSRQFSTFLAMDADNEALYLSDDRSHVWAIDRRTGSAFWKQEALNARKITAPRLVGNALVVADLEGYIHRLDKRDGALTGRIDTTGKRYLSQPLLLDDKIIALDSTGQLTALRLDD